MSWSAEHVRVKIVAELLSQLLHAFVSFGCKVFGRVDLVTCRNTFKCRPIAAHENTMWAVRDLIQ